MVELNLFIGFLPVLLTGEAKTQTDVAEHPKAFDHVGLLVNELSGTAGLPFI